MSLARKIFSNTVWQVLGRVVTAVLGVVSIKFITNYLSPSMYGEYTTVYDYTALFAIIADFGFFTIAVREMAHDSRKEMVQKIVGNILALRGVLALLALGLGILIAFVLPSYHGSKIPFGVMLVSFATILTLIAGTMSSVLQLYLRMQWVSIALVVGKVITVGYIIITILLLFPNDPERGFSYLLLAWIIGGLVTLLITYIASARCVSIRVQWDFFFWKTVLIKALPYGAALVLGTMYFRMGTITLSLFRMKAETGYFGVPLRFLEILQIIPHYFMNSVLPVLTISIAHDRERAVRIVRYALNALAALAFPILVGGYLLAWPLTTAVSNPQFLTSRIGDTVVWGSDLALKILLIAMTATYLHVVLSYSLVAMGKQIELLWVNAVAVVVNILSNLLLVPYFGFIGASVSAVLVECVMLGLLVLRIRIRMRKIWDFSFLGKTVFSSLLMGGVLFFVIPPLHTMLKSFVLFLAIPIGVLVYATTMLLTRALSKEMFSLLRKTESAPGELEIMSP